jgi:hypothetical protein
VRVSGEHTHRQAIAKHVAPHEIDRVRATVVAANVKGDRVMSLGVFYEQRCV